MQLPPSLKWIEVDLPEILAYKDELLKAEKPVCMLERVRVPLQNFQVLRRTLAKHVQGIGSAKDTQTMLRHTKPDTAQINYVQPVEDSERSAVDKLAATLLG